MANDRPLEVKKPRNRKKLTGEQRKRANELQNIYNANHPDSQRNFHLKRRYGITLEDKRKMFEEQKGLCGLCGFSLPVSVTICHVEHDHATGKVRSLVHGGCNVFIGKLEKDPDLITKFLAYVKVHNVQ